MYNTVIPSIHTTQKHQFYQEEITCILNVVDRNKVDVFKAM